MGKDKKYAVVMSKFIGYSENGAATYEITFNKSLEHTGRFKGISDGLNDYVRKERKKEFSESIPNVWNSFWAWIRSF